VLTSSASLADVSVNHTMNENDNRALDAVSFISKLDTIARNDVLSRHF